MGLRSGSGAAWNATHLPRRRKFFAVIIANRFEIGVEALKLRSSADDPVPSIYLFVFAPATLCEYKSLMKPCPAVDGFSSFFLSSVFSGFTYFFSFCSCF